MKAQIVALFLICPGALTQDILKEAQARPAQINQVVSPEATFGGDGMDGPMQMQPVAGSRHFSKAQMARGAQHTGADLTPQTEEQGIDASALLAVPFFAVILCGAAFCLNMTEGGRSVAKSFGLNQPLNKWSKLDVGDKSASQDDNSKWISLALESPLVQQAMVAMGMVTGGENAGTEMSSPTSEENCKFEAKKEACRKAAQEKLEQASKAEPQEASMEDADHSDSKSAKAQDSSEVAAPKEESLMDDELVEFASDEPSFDPVTSTAETVLSQLDQIPTTTFTFDDDEDELGADAEDAVDAVATDVSPTLAENPAACIAETPAAEAAAEEPSAEVDTVEAPPPAIEKISAGFTFDDDDDEF